MNIWIFSLLLINSWVLSSFHRDRVISMHSNGKYNAFHFGHGLNHHEQDSHYTYTDILPSGHRINVHHKDGALRSDVVLIDRLGYIESISCTSETLVAVSNSYPVEWEIGSFLHGNQSWNCEMNEERGYSRPFYRRISEIDVELRNDGKYLITCKTYDVPPTEAFASVKYRFSLTPLRNEELESMKQDIIDKRYWYEYRSDDKWDIVKIDQPLAFKDSTSFDDGSKINWECPASECYLKAQSGVHFVLDVRGQWSGIPYLEELSCGAYLNTDFSFIFNAEATNAKRLIPVDVTKIPLNHFSVILYGIVLIFEPTLQVKAEINLDLPSLKIKTGVTWKKYYEQGVRYTHSGGFGVYQENHGEGIKYTSPTLSIGKGEVKISIIPSITILFNKFLTLQVLLSPYIHFGLQPTVCQNLGIIETCSATPIPSRPVICPSGTHGLGGYFGLDLRLSLLPFSWSLLGINFWKSEKTFNWDFTIIPASEISKSICPMCGICINSNNYIFGKKRAIVDSVPYWTHKDWSDCSAECGVGYQNAIPSCMIEDMEQDNSSCADIRPYPSTRTCQGINCKGFCKNSSCETCLSLPGCVYCEKGGCQFGSVCNDSDNQIISGHCPSSNNKTLNLTSPTPNAVWRTSNDFLITWTGGGPDDLISLRYTRLDGDSFGDLEKNGYIYGGGIPNVFKNNASFSWIPTGWKKANYTFSLKSISFPLVEITFNVSIDSSANELNSYSYHIGNWGSCYRDDPNYPQCITKPGTLGIKQRLMECRNSSGDKVSESLCPPKPEDIDICELPPCLISPLFFKLGDKTRYSSNRTINDEGLLPDPYNISYTGGSRDNYILIEFWNDPSLQDLGLAVTDLEDHPFVGLAPPDDVLPIELFFGPNTGTAKINWPALLPTGSSYVLQIQEVDVAKTPYKNSDTDQRIVAVTRQQPTNITCITRKDAHKDIYVSVWGKIKVQIYIGESQNDDFILQAGQMYNFVQSERRPGDIAKVLTNQSDILAYLVWDLGVGYRYELYFPPGNSGEWVNGIYCNDYNNCNDCAKAGCGWCDESCLVPGPFDGGISGPALKNCSSDWIQNNLYCPNLDVCFIGASSSTRVGLFFILFVWLLGLFLY